MRTMWSFETDKLRVSWDIDYEHGYQYDGEDPDGSTQAALDNGSMVAFDSRLMVQLKASGAVLAEEWLGGSVYDAGDEASWKGDGYFKDMLGTVLREARTALPRARG